MFDDWILGGGDFVWIFVFALKGADWFFVFYPLVGSTTRVMVLVWEVGGGRGWTRWPASRTTLRVVGTGTSLSGQLFRRFVPRGSPVGRSGKVFFRFGISSGSEESGTRTRTRFTARGKEFVGGRGSEGISAPVENIGLTTSATDRDGWDSGSRGSWPIGANNFVSMSIGIRVRWISVGMHRGGWLGLVIPLGPVGKVKQ